MDDICPACGEDDLKHWNQGIYECESCGAMMDLEEDECHKIGRSE